MLRKTHAEKSNQMAVSDVSPQEGDPRIKVTGMTVGNLKRTPERCQNSVFFLGGGGGGP